MERKLTVREAFAVTSGAKIGIVFVEHVPAPRAFGPVAVRAAWPDGCRIVSNAHTAAASLTGGLGETLALWIIGGVVADYPAGTTVTFDDLT